MFNLRNYSIGTRLILSTFGALFLMVVFVGIDLFSLNEMSDKVDHIVNNNIKKAELAVGMRERNLLIARHVRTALIYQDVDKQLGEKPKVDADMAKYLAAEGQIVETTLTASGKDIIGRILPARQAADVSIGQLFALIKEGNRAAAEAHFFNDLRPKLQTWFDVVGDYVQLQQANNVRDVDEVNELKSKVRSTMLLLVLIAFAVMIPTGIWLTRQITRPLRQALAVADAVAAGNMENEIDLAGRDEPAQLMSALDKMQSDLKQRARAERQVADETLRLKVALDVASNNVMVADPDGRIIYCNASLLDMMQQAEGDLRRELPNFRADAILGSSFDIYSRQPGRQRNLLTELQASCRSEMTIANRHFSLVVNPIINERGEHLGTVVEWHDRTSEVAIEGEVAGIIDAAVAGDFGRRLDSAKMNGFFKKISQGINDLLEANTRALGDLGAMLGRMSEGNLTQKIDSNYQGLLGKLKDDANATVDNLQQIVFAIKDATLAINTAAQEIASGNQDLSSRTEEQASSLEETASSMEQITSTVKQSADNSRQANELALRAQQVAIKGGEAVGQVVQTMNAIHQSSTRIADIIGVIDGIAFQTNILALNAAVEAARAGEQGRGFAVVATEVRNLAQRSAAAAKEIKGLISDSVEKVAVGNRQVDQAGRTMEEVVASIKRLAKIMADISEAGREQSVGIEQVCLAVSQMDEVTQQNAALVEEAAAAAESLEEQARSLAQSVAVFRLPGGVVVDNQSGLAGLDFDGAISAHSKWRQRLLDYLAGSGEQLDPAVVGRDDQCALGCWIHGDGSVLRGDAKYAELKVEHAGFHQCAASIIRAQIAGDGEAAHERIEGEFSSRSRRVIGLLESMRRGGKAEPPKSLAATPPARVSMSRTAALVGPDEDEWTEF
ncbi:MAG: Histidine kinase, region:Bacterial chemotaxis sensory transducer [Proteobacteria bacterium]|nr:Histidine kinase, region:Bacterial chemotaxis sensory transducer [Pseudomonadota bacterium]